MASYERYQLKGGETRWRVWWRDPDHKRKNKSGFKTKRDASEWAAGNVAVAMNDGAFLDPQGGRVLIGVLGDEWITARENVWKPSHAYAIESSWKTHVRPKWGERTPGEVRHSEVQNWVNALSAERPASVVLRAFGILKGIYETARDDGRISRLPVANIQLPTKTRQKRVYLTPGQLSKLADCSGVHRPLILVLGLCGLRWGEATALTVGDVDFAMNRLHVNKSVSQVGGGYQLGSPKNGRSRDVPMFRPVADALHEAVRDKASDDLLFPSATGGYMPPQGKRHEHSWYGRALKASGVPPLTCHDLRHTAASIAVHSGANVKVIQRMLGHSSAAMTLDIYADLFDADMDSLTLDVNAAIADVFDEDE